MLVPAMPASGCGWMLVSNAPASNRMSETSMWSGRFGSPTIRTTTASLAAPIGAVGRFGGGALGVGDGASDGAGDWLGGTDALGGAEALGRTVGLGEGVMACSESR